MLALNTQERTRFPNLTLLCASAVNFGLSGTESSTDAICLSAILGSALSFGTEAEGGVFSSIFLVYSQGDQRVNLTVTQGRYGVYQLVVERLAVTSVDSYEAGLIASCNAYVGDWHVEASHIAGEAVTATEFLNSIALLPELMLTAKEISEPSSINEGDM